METIRQVRREFRQLNQAAPEKVFPLLCPVREREWAVGWACEMVHSSSGVAELGAVFTTARSGEADTVWVITTHDTVSGRVEFATFTPGSRVGRIEIKISPASEDASHVDIAYSYVALSNAGEKFTHGFSEEHYREMMREWEEEINHFLVSGEMLRR